MIPFSRRRLISVLGAGAVSTGCPSLLMANATRPPITTVRFAVDGQSIVAGSQAGISIRTPAGEVLREIECQMDNVNATQFLPNGDTLLVAGGVPGEAGVMERFDWPAATRQRRVVIHDDLLYGLGCSPDGSRYAVGSGDGACSVRSVRGDKRVSVFSMHSRAVLAAVFLRDNRTVVSASRDQTLRVWDSESGQSIRTLHNHSRDVSALATRPMADGLPMVASASADLTVRFWQPTIGRMVRFIRLPSEPLCIEWLDNGERLVAGCRDGKARVIDPVNVVVDQTLEVSPGWIHCAAVDPLNQRRFVLGTIDGQTRMLSI